MLKKPIKFQYYTNIGINITDTFKKKNCLIIYTLLTLF